jgi:hypothetical protein
MPGTDFLIIVYRGSGPGSIAVMSGEVPLAKWAKVVKAANIKPQL